MKTPSIITSLNPAINVLANCLARTSENYQQLLNQPESYSFCREAGRSMRHLSEHYAQVLLAALAYPPDSDDDAENWDDEDDTAS